MDNFVLRNNFDYKKLFTKKVMILIIQKIEEMVNVHTSRKKKVESA